MEKELWKKIKGFPDYEISNHGRVKSLKFGKIKYLSLIEERYFFVMLSKGKAVRKRVHSLVAEHFVKGKNGLRKNVNHKDGNKLNNYFENLEWVTYKQNLNHARKLGLNKPHKKMRKLSDNQIKEIRELKKNKTLKQLSKIYGVTPDHISKICNFRFWVDI